VSCPVTSAPTSPSFAEVRRGRESRRTPAEGQPKVRGDDDAGAGAGVLSRSGAKGTPKGLARPRSGSASKGAFEHCAASPWGRWMTQDTGPGVKWPDGRADVRYLCSSLL
jgi:hypothetical protein